MSLYQTLTARNYSAGEIEAFVPTKFTFAILFLSVSQSLFTEPTNDSELNDLVLADLLPTRRKLKRQTPTENILQQNPKYFDNIVKNLYNDMRITYDTEPDDVIISSLNALFSPRSNSEQSKIFFSSNNKFPGRYAVIL